MAGYTGDEATARAALSDELAAVRAAGLGALARLVVLKPRDLQTALGDPAALVRRRACELAARPGLAETGGRAWVGVGSTLTRALSDPDPSVVEAACYALGEIGAGDLPGAGTAHLATDGLGTVAGREEAEPARKARGRRVAGVVEALAAVAKSHPEPLCREASVAALGALGHPGGLRAVLSAMEDKPAVRRRAAVALAAFEGPEVELALERAAHDRDWQVRQVAEDLLGRR